MKKLIAVLMMAALMMTMLVGCAGASSQEETATEAVTPAQEPQVIKLGHVLTTDHPVNLALTQMAEKVSERTEGMVEIQVYPNGELASYGDSAEAMMSGAAYMTYTAPGDLSDYVNNFKALQAPFLYDGFDHYAKFSESEVVGKIIDEANEAGIQVLSVNFISGFRNLLTDYPVNSVEDIKNLKIRVPAAPTYTVPFELMGATPSGIAWNETYTSLQQGVIDAIEGTSNNIYNAKMYEINNIVTESEHIIDVSGLFISSEFWSTIPVEYQTIIMEEVKAAEAYQNGMAEENVEKFKTLLEDEGVTFNKVDKSSFKKATESVILDFEIGQEILDTLESLR